jgi:hypothetical protein
MPLWYLRRAVPWASLLGCLGISAPLIAVARGSHTVGGPAMLLAALLVAASAAFLYDEPAAEVTTVTPRASRWAPAARSAPVAVPLLAYTGLTVDLREADVPHVPGLDHLLDRAHRFLDRHRRVQPGGTVDVDVVGAQPGQRVGQEVPHRLGTAVLPAEHMARPPQLAELDAEHVAVPVPAAQRLGEQQLVVAHGVEVAGVDQREAGLQRGVHRGDALRAVGRTVGARHAHRAQAERGNGRPGAAQGSCLHRVSPSSVRPTLRLRRAARERSVHHGRAAPWIGSPAARQHGAMQRDQLADFLRRRREAVHPAEVGIAEGPRRRTTGLRRHHHRGVRPRAAARPRVAAARARQRRRPRTRARPGRPGVLAA